MNLQIDAGNTRLKWRLRRDGQTLAHGVGDYAEQELFADAYGYDVQRVVVSAVISKQGRHALSRQVLELFNCTAEFCDARSAQCGIRSAYDCPQSLGTDRWHAMIAAHASGSGGAIIVDAGSALTVDFLSAPGDHLGGYILPGRRLMMESLRLQTAKVAFEGQVGEATAPGQSTQDGVLSGLNWLCSALGERITADARRGGFRQILITGGDAGHILALGFPGEHRPDLVLDGLEIVARESASQ